MILSFSLQNLYYDTLACQLQRTINTLCNKKINILKIDGTDSLKQVFFYREKKLSFSLIWLLDYAYLYRFVIIADIGGE